ncbi:hypothetical protein L6452_13143 [Arctium lappa]|uniref:Uncharacterized protein n=1 Tax=Arctium lappa TaxID=4217 RepID=A0ACB9CHH0_ARCLA|nr:hypothetical protein L6452_13143 [Arctium lappa]
MNPTSLSTFSSIAYRCLKKCREDRPTMSQIVGQLQKALDYQLVGSSGLCDDASREVCDDDAVDEELSTPASSAQGSSIASINDLKPRLKELLTLKGHVESMIELKGLDIENFRQSYSV